MSGVALDEITASMGRPPYVQDGYALFDCPVCQMDAKWAQSTGAVKCLAGCDTDLVLARLHTGPTGSAGSTQEHEEHEELLPGQPAPCPDAAHRRYPSRTCPACQLSEAWAKQYAREALRPEPVAWTFVDLTTIVLDEVPPHPTIGRFAPDKALFRAGALNGLHGKPGSGKTWVMYLAMAQETQAGNHVLLLDWEMGQREVAVRLSALGADLSKVLYPQIEGAINADELKRRFGHLQVTLIGIDSVGEAMSASGLDSYNDGDTARWIAEVPKTLSAIWPDAAAVMVDHLPKSVPSTQELYPIGSQRKLAAATTQYLVRTLAEFARDRDGRSVLVCAKDRGGSYLRDASVAMLTAGPAGFVLREVAEVDKKAVAEHSIRQAVLDLVEAEPGIKIGDIKKQIKGTASEIVAQVEELTSCGHLVLERVGNSKTYTIAPDRVVVDIGNTK